MTRNVPAAMAGEEEDGMARTAASIAALKRRMGEFDWHDSTCAGGTWTELGGEDVTEPCDCGMPEMFRSSYAAGRTAGLDEADTAVRRINGNGRDEPSDPALDAALAAISALRGRTE